MLRFSALNFPKHIAKFFSIDQKLTVLSTGNRDEFLSCFVFIGNCDLSHNFLLIFMIPDQ